MINSAIVYAGQSFLDKVIECTGSIENAFEMALLNNVSISDVMEVGTELKPSAVTNRSVVAMFNQYNRPATASNVETEAESDNYELPGGELPYSL